MSAAIKASERLGIASALSLLAMTMQDVIAQRLRQEPRGDAR
jgi:hypothetical protein